MIGLTNEFQTIELKRKRKEFVHFNLSAVLFVASIIWRTGMTLTVDKSAIIASAAAGEVTFIRLVDLKQLC